MLPPFMTPVKIKRSSTAIMVTMLILILTFGSLPLVTPTYDPPRVVSEVIEQQVANVGDTIVLSCPVEADPPPLLQWSKDGVYIHGGWDRFKILSLSLFIEDVETEDSGAYQCEAINGFGRVIVTYILTVQQSMMYPYFNQRPERLVEVVLGESVDLTCVATGSPIPCVAWLHGDLDMTTEQYNNTVKNVLHLNYVQESVNYTCIAVSALGTIESTSAVLVRESEVPPPPQNLTVKVINPNTSVVEWDQSHIDGDIIGRYMVFYTDNPDQPMNTWKEYEVAHCYRMLALINLKADTVYYTCILASTGAGDGPVSEMVQFRTPPECTKCHS